MASQSLKLDGPSGMPMMDQQGQGVGPRMIIGEDGKLVPLCFEHRYSINVFSTSDGGREYDLICELCGDARTVIPTRA